MKPSDLARKNHDGDYQNRSTIFFDKLFGRNGRKNRFATDVGIVQIHEVILKHKPIDKGPVEVFSFTTDEPNWKWPILQKLFESTIIMGFRGGCGIEFRASSEDDSIKQYEIDLDLEDFVKTPEEFGGTKAGGKSTNFGLEYEGKLAETFEAMLDTSKDWRSMDYNKHVSVINEALLKEVRKNNKDIMGPSYVKHAGAANESRPLAIGSGGGVIIRPGGKGEGQSVGDVLTDITIQYGGKHGKLTTNARTFYISVKYGSTLSFFNSGVQGKKKDAIPFFPTTKMEKGEIPKDGQTLLNMFNIDQTRFIDVFRRYKKGVKTQQDHIVKTNLNPEQVKSVRKMAFTGIGYGYWMAHFIDGKFHFYEVNKRYAVKASKLSSNTMEIQYGGTRGDGKRVNMVFETAMYEFSFNIRNTQGGLWPSRTNGDYTKK